MKKILLLSLFVYIKLFSSAQPIPFTGCPGNNVAVLRAGNNSAVTNPLSIYDVNSLTGSFSLRSGPILDPSNPAVNLQVNGLGLNSLDGFLYGINSNSTANLTTNTPVPFYRLGANSVAVQTGNLPGPVLAAGETQSFVNPAAGEIDKSGNYYFTGATATANFAAQSLHINRLFVGKLSSLNSLAASTTTVLSPVYTPITTTDPNCADYLSTLITTFTALNIADAANTGLKDLVYDSVSGNLYSYVTYPNPANPSSFMGLMVKLNPLTGDLKAVAAPVVLAFASASIDVAGTLLDKSGNFLILFTDGNVYKANTLAPDVFTGSITALNIATGLPSVLRGDMASCGAGGGSGPVPFNGCPDVNLAILRAGTNSSTTNPISIYDVNTATGTPGLRSGPILDPANAANNLQVNGLGLNSTDGFLYGLDANNTANLTTNNPIPFYRVGANAVAVQTGNMPGPALVAGETQTFVNPAAGEMDKSDNYYFSGATATTNFATQSIHVNRLFIGKLAAVSTLASSTSATLSPTYTLITSTDPNCTDYLASLTATFTLANISGAANTGLRDLVFDNVSGNLYSYVTYPNPANPASFMGLMIKLNPATGDLKAVAAPVVLPFASASNEVAGTLLDKNGNFLILFTTGTIYKANTASTGVFDGSISALNLSTGLPSPLRGDMASCGAGGVMIPVPFKGCPDINLSILRAGTNGSTTNPISIYDLNTTTGTPVFRSGPILDPANAANNLQVNGLGLNTRDGLLYGLDANNTANLTTNMPIPFYRVGANALAVQTGNMPGPALAAGETQTFVNPAAGEMDKSDNYYFSGATATANLATQSIHVNRLFIGKLVAVSTLASSTSATLSPVYTPITSTDPNCTDFLASLTATFTLANISGAASTGLKDFAFDNLSGSLYSYVTYLNPANPASYLGLMLKLNPATGDLKAVAAPVVLPFVSASNEVAGTLLDKNGNFIIMFTNGSMYKANTISPGVYDGSISPLNTGTGLPSPLRGDLASCGASAVLPIVLTYFNAYSQDNTAILKWETSFEHNAGKFIIEKSTDGNNWTTLQSVAAAGNSASATQYRYDDKNINAKTVYYRIKFADTDGSFRYSAIKKLSFNGVTASLIFYPNPVSNLLYAENGTAFTNKIQVTVSDVSGKQYAISFKKTDSNKISVDLTVLPAGVYLIQITDGVGHNNSQKVIKQ